jgi:hypothetical protein
VRRKAKVPDLTAFAKNKNYGGFCALFFFVVK